MLNNILLFPLPGRDYPFGYLIGGICLIIAIVLFVMSIFMKDKSNDYDDEQENWDDNYSDDGYNDEGYDDSEEYDDRYANKNYRSQKPEGNNNRYVSDKEEREARLKKETVELKNLVADVTNELEQTRAFKPINQASSVNVHNNNNVSQSAANGQGNASNPSGRSNISREERENARLRRETQVMQRAYNNQNEVYDDEEDEDNEGNRYSNSKQKNEKTKAAFNEEFSDEIDDEIDADVKVMEKTKASRQSESKTGLSFAEEVKRLIEEEEQKRNK